MPPAADTPRDDAPRALHLPVMLEEVVELADVRAGVTIVDGTFGGGGHARALAAQLDGSGTYVAVDRDPAAQARFDAFAFEVVPLETRFLRAPFPEAFQQLAEEGMSADVVILDIGVSSMQLDEPERGFAYAQDAPLDMRMDPSSGRGAAELLASVDEGELARILREYGEERHAQRIARGIVRRRDAQPFTRTADLVDVILGSLPAAVRHAPGGHPARRTFQALRIAVNDELEMLDAGLDAAFELLAPDGRLLVMSFHSLEDRMVKRRFERWVGACACPPGLPICGCGAMRRAQLLTRGAARPSEAEVATNRRAASTRLRALRRIEPPVPVAGESGGAR